MINSLTCYIQGRESISKHLQCISFIRYKLELQLSTNRDILDIDLIFCFFDIQTFIEDNELSSFCLYSHFDFHRLGIGLLECVIDDSILCLHRELPLIPDRIRKDYFANLDRGSIHFHILGNISIRRENTNSHHFSGRNRRAVFNRFGIGIQYFHTTLSGVFHEGDSVTGNYCFFECNNKGYIVISLICTCIGTVSSNCHGY
ncbi:hypothetical protein PORCAN_1943 [Porphyromonas crevioricanis JCM 13913]|nr:hypothetical protein PORCAN_1943 [Porphyromonas crevioricanis JCM 13913]